MQRDLRDKERFYFSLIGNLSMTARKKLELRNWIFKAWIFLCEKEDNLFSKTAKNIIELESKTCEEVSFGKGEWQHDSKEQNEWKWRHFEKKGEMQ